MVKFSIDMALWINDFIDCDVKFIESLIFEALQDGNASAEDQKRIADLFNPNGKLKYKAKIFRRQGDKKSNNKAHDDKYDKFYDLYIRLGRDLTKTTAQAQENENDGGLGFSRKIAYKYRTKLEHNEIYRTGD